MFGMERENFAHYWMRQIQMLMPHHSRIEFFTTPEEFGVIKARKDLGENDFNFSVIFPEKKLPGGVVFTPTLQIVFTWQLVHHFIGVKELQDDHRVTLSKAVTIFEHLQTIDLTQLNAEQPCIRCTINEELQPTLEKIMPEGLQVQHKDNRS